MIYAIGDIHGHLDKLKLAHEAIEADRARVGGAAKRAPIIHIGDLVDRGPDASGVIDYLINGIDGGKDWLIVRGNHDQMFVNFVRHGVGTVEGRKAPHWLSDTMGGSETMKSYGVKRRFTERQGSFQRRARLASIVACVKAGHWPDRARLPARDDPGQGEICPGLGEMRKCKKRPMTLALTSPLV